MNESSTFGSPSSGPWVAALIVVLLGMVIRFGGIHLEPIWLDEAFSVEFSNGSVADVLRVNARDAHPPLYYLALKTWRAVFGDSVTALRSLSTLWSGVGLVIIVLFAWHLTHSEFAALVAGGLFAINPLDVYFAQEARMFTQVSALGLVSSWCLYRWLESRTASSPGLDRALWLVGYVTSATAALLSHSAAAFLVASQLSFACGHCVRSRDRSGVLAGGLATLSIGLLFLPWALFTREVGASLYSAKVLGWIPMPAVSDLFAHLSSDFYFPFAPMSREVVFVLRAGSTIVFVAAVVLLAVAVVGKRVDPLPVLFLGWNLFAPVIAAFVVSVLIYPVYYRPRFVVMVLPYFILLLTISLYQIKPPVARWAVVIAVSGFMLTGTAYQGYHITKKGLKGIAAEYERGPQPEYVVMFPRHNAILASFYVGRPIGRPRKSAIERSLRGDISSTIWVCVAHEYLKEAPAERRALYEWLISLGPCTLRATVDGIDIIEIRAEPLPRVYPELSPGQRIEFASDVASEYLWDGWYGAEKGFRWSRGARAQFLFSLADADCDLSSLRLMMACFDNQDVTVELNDVVLESFPCSQRSFHERRLSIPAGAARPKNELDFFLPKAISPIELLESDDRRNIAIAVQWLEFR